MNTNHQHAPASPSRSASGRPSVTAVGVPATPIPATPISATPVPAAGDQGSRNTRQRTQVSEAIRSCKSFVSAQQLHQILTDRRVLIGLSTVYRNLAALAAAGEIDAVRTPAGEMTYRACTPAHHHHLTCRRCGRTVEIAAPSLERLTGGLARRHGFSDVEHTLEITGVCPGCR